MGIRTGIWIAIGIIVGTRVWMEIGMGIRLRIGNTREVKTTGLGMRIRI